MITIKESKLSKNGQVTLPVHFRKYILQENNKVFLYQTEIEGVQCLILAPVNIDNNNQKKSIKK